MDTPATIFLINFSWPGTSIIVIDLFKYAKPRSIVIPLDFSSEMGELAHQQQGENARGLNYIRGDAMSPPFPKEYFEWSPRSYVERIYNIQRLTEMPKGGHFAALEQPDLLVKDIREFAKDLKKI